jgi:mannose-6-phosphate isomerase-like protein (cupin superfamily)
MPSHPLIATWRQRGHSVLPSLLEPDERLYLRSLDVGAPALCEDNELKRLWMVDARVRHIATAPVLREHLERLFDGGGYYLWGAQLIERRPGEDHPWHSDLETCAAPGDFVSLWIPVSGVEPANTLRVIDGSHRFGQPLQAHFDWGDPARDDPDGLSIMALASGSADDARLTAVVCSDGDGVFFDGCLWHGTFNRGRQSRRSLLLQYGRHTAPVRRVTNRRVYPPEMDERQLPAVLPLSGTPNPLLNHNVFVDRDELVYPRASIARRPTLDNDNGQAWRRFPYFKTRTDVCETLICHASELLPGCMPHLPHSHHLEELLLILDGEATIFSHDPERGVLQAVPAGPGDVFYYPKGHLHTIANHGARPIHYLMFRWKTHAAPHVPAQAYRYRARDYTSGEGRFSVDRPSSGLAHLHCHFTRLQPGERFPSHIDRYDTAILVQRGTLSMLDRELGPGGVFFARAGELHNTRNESSGPCEYIVFEFHARTGD